VQKDYTSQKAPRGVDMSAVRGEEDPEREVARRLEICRGCEKLYLNPAVEVIMGERGSQCKVCHCFVFVKSKFLKFHCPIGKW
jgi:hypothetical protein